MKTQKQTGQAMIEFAISGTLFITLLLFVVDGGRMLWRYVAVAEGARVGARYAITHGSSSAAPVSPGNQVALENEIRNRVAGLDPVDSTVTVAWVPSNDPGSKVRVTVSYRARPLTTLFWPDSVVTLSSTSTMVIES